MSKGLEPTPTYITNLALEHAENVIELYSEMRDTWFRLEEVRSLIATHPSAGAWRAGALIGFCYCSQLAPNLIEIKNIYVARTAQSDGTGTALLQHIERATSTAGFSGLLAVNSLLYETKSPLRNAENFYAHNGFSTIAQFGETRVFSKQLSSGNLRPAEGFE